jgi:lipopolysaccharide export system protein LptA
VWRKRLRLGIAVFGVCLMVFVLYVIRPRETRQAPAPIERIDPKAMVETRGCDVVQLKGSTQDLRIECDTQITYEDGQTALKGVTLTVDNRAGRSFKVTGDEARVGTNQSTFDINGDVRLEASDGLVATAGSASYVDTEGVVRAPGPVQFTRGGMAGAGIGFSFDEQRNTVWLLDQAVVRFAGDGANGPMDVAAGAAGFARGERYMRFERGVRMTRQGQLIEADEATVYLFADRDEPDQIELRGNSRITGGEGVGALRLMRARDINLDYADDGRTLQQATLAGQSAVRIASAGAGADQQLSGEFIAFELDPDGTIKSLSSRDNVAVTLPAVKEAPGRTIRSEQLTGSGAPGQGLTAMKFEGSVVFAEAAAKDRGARTARSRLLDLRLNPQTGALDEARFGGGVRFEDGALVAQSGEATYRLGGNGLDLRGKNGAADPFVNDETIRVDAESIDLTLAPRRMVAKGKVRSVLQPSRPRPGQAAAKRPGLLGDADPVNVIAGELTYDEDSRRGVYTGQSRLWQGETVIQAERITLDEAKGDLSADGGVMTTLALASDTAQPKPQTRPAPTILRGATFTYRDDTRKAIYDTKAQMNGEQGDLRANHIELLLAAGENKLDRLDARGAVDVTLDKRRASGATLVYRPADERYEISGAPGRFIDECNESAGKTLTFFKSSDRVIIDGNEEVRTETRGGKCAAKPPS